MNPFLINAYLQPAYFCDREEELKSLLENIRNNSNTTLFAQRRLGKTALIHHVLYNQKKTAGIYIDIYATQNLKDFTNELANGIYKVFPKNKSIGKKFWESIKLLRPVLSIDNLDGNPQLSLDITQPQQFEKTIPQLLQFLEKQNKKTVIAIDEFQQIVQYPEKNVEAILRTAIQPLKNVSFIFSGSNQTMMQQLFNSAKRPFYASTKTMHLQKINELHYMRFIKNHFDANKFKINMDALVAILELTHGHTYFTQYLCHQLFAKQEKNINEEAVATTLNEILLENQAVYFQYRNLLTPSQWHLLKAIAKQEKVMQPYSIHFTSTHKLGTSAMVKRGLEALVQKEMIYHNTSVELPYYEVGDKFLMQWLKLK